MAKKFLYRVFCGFFLGLSVFAPGFSGSVVALTLGIYRDLVRIASNPFKDLKKNILYCLPLGIGAAASAAVFLLAFRYLFETYEKSAYLLFVGLITGNLPLIFAEVRRCGFKKHYLIGGGAAFAAALAMGLFSMGNLASAGQAGAAGLTAGLPLLALSGFAAGAVAPVPGMSVTMILILMRVYGQLLFAGESFLHLDFTYLLPFALFALCSLGGVVLTSRGIRAVFEKAPGFASSMVFGFMAGSLLGILAESLRMEDPEFNWLQGGIMLAAGLGISMLFVVVGRVMDKAETGEKGEE